MISEIAYSGIATTPSDYECKDGQLAAAMNLACEASHLNPTLDPKEIFTLGEQQKTVFIHKVTGSATEAANTHYICETSSQAKVSVGWRTAAGTPQDKIHDFEDAKPTAYNAVGNTLIIFTPDAIHYFLWRDNAYIALGNKVPDIGISFGLRGQTRFSRIHDDDSYELRFNGLDFEPIAQDRIYEDFSDTNKAKITSQVLANYNKFVADNSTNCGRFVMPFLVRYALRLYDGTLINHSAPVLMTPSTSGPQILVFNFKTGKGGNYDYANYAMFCVSAQLDYLPLPANLNTLKTHWKDLVKSVDVFISAPFYTYDQSGQCTSFIRKDTLKDCFFVGALDMEINDGYLLPKNNKITPPVIIRYNGTEREYTQADKGTKPEELTKNYNELPYDLLFSLSLGTLQREIPGVSVELPSISPDKIKENLNTCSNFYLLKSIPIDELPVYTNQITLNSAPRIPIEIDNDSLQSLVNREVMTDDYQSHDRLMADYSHAYNGRINLAGVKRELFKGFEPSAQLCYRNCGDYAFAWQEWQEVPGSEKLYEAKYEFHSLTHPLTSKVWIKKNDETYQVENNSDMLYLAQPVSYKPVTATDYYPTSWACYVSYPNPDAFKIELTYPTQTAIFDLQEHPFLNAAICVSNYNTVRTPYTGETPTPTVGENIVSMPNKIYTSHLNNPFFFPLSGINTVGTGDIIGISSANKALSQGQFGQFPLYVFSTEGIWAMEINSEGKYIARQPISRDVCVCPKSITQLDSAVLFATARGILSISGSTVQTMSAQFDEGEQYDWSALPNIDKITTPALGAQALTFVPFLKFIEDCQMIYDYLHSRVIVFNKQYPYAYILSLKSQQWTMMLCGATNTLNSYPNAMANTINAEGKNVLVDFSRDKDSAQTANGFFITRPLKLSNADTLKTLQSAIQRGVFKRADIKCILYASRDLIDWHIIHSSKDIYLRGVSGTPYKYFRIACATTFTKKKSVYGVSIMHTEKYTNKLR